MSAIDRLNKTRFTRRQLLLLGVGLALAACKGGSSSGSGPSATAPAPTPEVPPTVAPSPTATVRPEGIEVRGADSFKAWTQQALDLLRTKAPPEYQLVMSSISIIESVTAGSGIAVQEKRFKVGDITAYAPGHPQPQQLIWYAGAIVHDANHSALFARGQPYSGKDAEVACLKVQKEALLKIETNNYFSSYVQGLIDGADDPRNQYWNQPNRHW